MGRETDIDECTVKGRHKTLGINSVYHTVRQFFRYPLGQVRVGLPYEGCNDAIVLVSLNQGNLQGYFQSVESLHRLFILRDGVLIVNRGQSPEPPRIVDALKDIEGTDLDVFTIGGLYLPQGLRSYDFVLPQDRTLLRLRAINDPDLQRERVYLSYLRDLSAGREAAPLAKLRRGSSRWQYHVSVPTGTG